MELVHINLHDGDTHGRRVQTSDDLDRAEAKADPILKLESQGCGTATLSP